MTMKTTINIKKKKIGTNTYDKILGRKVRLD